MERRLQLAATFAFLILCLVATALGVKMLVSPAPAGNRVAAARPPALLPPMLKVGESIALKAVDFSESESNLVLVIRKGCRFCDESMPFYKRLGDDSSLAKRARIIVAAPDDESVSREDLAAMNVRVDQVVKVPLGQLKVRGTPTVIVVDRRSIVRQIVPGLMNEAKQKEFLDGLKGAFQP